jgi:hypothetical protein
MIMQCRITILFVLAFTLASQSATAQSGASGINLRSSLPISGVQVLSGRIAQTPKPSLPPVPRDVFAPFFLNDESFSPKLILQNLRVDSPITVHPAILTADREIPLGPITMGARSTTSIPLSDELAHIPGGRNGAVVVRYEFPTTGALSAVVESDDTTHGIFLTSLGNSIEEFRGTTLDGVLWAPDRGTEGFIAVLNTSAQPRHVKLSVFVNGKTIDLPGITVPSLRTQFVQINDLVEQSRKSGAGVHLEFDGKAGDIRAEGVLMLRKTGFSKRFQFVDKMLQFASPTLRTNLFFVGAQPAVDGFPEAVSFRSVAVVRNIDSSPVEVTPVIKFLRNGSLQTVTLPVQTVGANETDLVDFSGFQADGRIPGECHNGTLELVPSVGHAAMYRPKIIAELFNTDASTGGYVIGPSFTARASRGTSSLWRTDGSFQTVLFVDNISDKDDLVTLSLTHDGGTFDKSFPVAAGGLLRISIKDLQLGSVLGDGGSHLTGDYGTLNVFGSHGRNSAIAIDRIIYSASEADYLGFPANPCNYITNAFGIMVGNGNPFTTEIEDDWSDGSVTDTTTSPSFVSNTSVAQVSGSSVTLNPPSDGSSVDVTFDFNSVEVGCGGCSTTTTSTSLVVSGIRIASTFYTNPTNSAQGCFYASVACSSGTPTCLQQIGVSFAPSDICPAFIHAGTLAVGSTCFGPSIVTAAGGPGPCN